MYKLQEGDKKQTPKEETRNFRKLKEVLIKESISDNWDKVKEEWVCTDVYLEENDDIHCLCGHKIHEICHIFNQKLDKNMIVGNCCINYFMETKSNLIFQSLTRVKDDIRNSFNEATIEFLFSKEIINGWERNFYLDTWRKHKLSEKQLTRKIEINNKILKNLSRSDLNAST